MKSNPQDERAMGVIPSRYSPVRTEADGRVVLVSPMEPCRTRGGVELDARRDLRRLDGGRHTDRACEDQGGDGTDAPKLQSHGGLPRTGTTAMCRGLRPDTKR